MKKIYFLISTLIVTNAFSQINSPNGTNIFSYNGSAEVTFRFTERGSGGRAFVHAPNNILSLNHEQDFIGGTRIGNDVFFKDGGNSYILSGNFGIGTANPNSKFVIMNNNYGISFNPAAAAAGLGFNRNALDGTIFNTAIAAWQFSARDEMFTLEGYNGAQNQLFSVLKNGNVGIGTFTPAVKLDVNSIDVAAFFRSTSNSVPVSIINSGSSISTIGFKGSLTTSEYNVRIGANGNDLISYTGNVERMRIVSDGNIGIGTNSPSFYQHGGNNKEIEIFNSSTTANSQAHLILSTGSVLPNSSSGSLTWAMPNGASSNKGLAYLGVVTGINSTSTNPSSSMIFATRNTSQNNWSPNMILTESGNLGVGTLNPTSKLTVAGNINSREVKVTVDAGADFVFENDYNLPSLDAVDKYIKENKHLPEIASADEMKKDGINLSEMNIKLLQKIEEMTLYMIEMKKENEKQNEEIKILKTKLYSK